MREAPFVVYQSDNDEDWWWRFKAANGKTIARSSEGYRNERDCRHSINLVKGAAKSPVYDEDGNRIDKDGVLSEHPTAEELLRRAKS